MTGPLIVLAIIAAGCWLAWLASADWCEFEDFPDYTEGVTPPGKRDA